MPDALVSTAKFADLGGGAVVKHVVLGIAVAVVRVWAADVNDIVRS